MLRPRLFPIVVSVALSSVAVVTTAGAAPVPDSAELSEKEAHASFLKQIAKLEAAVKETKKKIFASEAEIDKLKKRVETAGWRVTAARKRFDEAQNKLSTTKSPEAQTKLKRKLQADRRLLKKDADKLNTMLERLGTLNTSLTALSEKLKPVTDDVAIEADRFDPEERGQKRAVRLVADAEWALNKLTELNGELTSDLRPAASENLRLTEVPQP